MIEGQRFYLSIRPPDRPGFPASWAGLFQPLTDVLVAIETPAAGAGTSWHRCTAPDGPLILDMATAAITLFGAITAKVRLLPATES